MNYAVVEDCGSHLPSSRERHRWEALKLPRLRERKGNSPDSRRPASLERHRKNLLAWLEAHRTNYEATSSLWTVSLVGLGHDQHRRTRGYLGTKLWMCSRPGWNPYRDATDKLFSVADCDWMTSTGAATNEERRQVICWL